MDVEKAVEESPRLLEYGSLKKEQKLAASAFISGKDTFVSLPTGFGKSLIYAVLPSAFDLMRGNVPYI